MATESTFRAPLIKNMRGMGAEILSIVGSKMQGDGWPDIHIDHIHWSGWIEFKGVKTLVKPHQTQKMKDLVAAGAKVYIARAPDKIYDHEEVLMCYFKPPLLLPTLIVLENSVNVEDYSNDKNT